LYSAETTLLEHLEVVEPIAFSFAIHEINTEDLTVSILADPCRYEKSLRDNPGTTANLEIRCIND
jgi:hypothetical protein